MPLHTATNSHPGLSSSHSSIDNASFPIVNIGRARIKLSPRFRLSPLYILSAIFLFLVILSQFLSLRNKAVELESPSRLRPFGDSVYRQEAYYEQREPGGQCKPRNISPAQFPQSHAPTNMALNRAVKKMASQFDYSAEEMKNGVKEFINQMNEGLRRQGAMMSQIPTYVTAVPNGTEKVRRIMQSTQLPV